MMKNALLFILFTFCACKHSSVDCGLRPDETAGIVVRVLPRNYIAYEAGNDLAGSGIHITTQQEYNRVFLHCCASRLDTVNFSQYDVLGLSTVNRGTGSNYVLDVKRDEATKKITYTVTERYCNRSSPVDGRGNFVVIPKVSPDYRVDYQRNQ